MNNINLHGRPGGVGVGGMRVVGGSMGGSGGVGVGGVRVVSGGVGGAAHLELGVTHALRVEGGHGDLVHGREVLLDHAHTPLVLLGVIVHAVVLLEVESVLGHPQRVGHVGLHPLHPLHALLAGELSGLAHHLVWVTRAPGLADVLGSVHEEVLQK